MIRWGWILAVALGATVGIAVAERLEAGPAGVHISGTLGGPHTDGGYFEVVTPDGQGQGELVIATPPDGPLYPTLVGMVGRQIQVSIFTVGEP